MKSRDINGAGYIGLLFCLLFSVMTVVLLEFSNRDSFSAVIKFMLNEPVVVALNIIIAASFSGIIYVIVRKVWLSNIILLIFSTLIGFVNISKFKYQGVPFLPWDIFFIEDAKRVMPAMKNEFLDLKSISFLGFAFILLLIIFAMYFFWDKKVNLKYDIRNPLNVIGTVLVVAMFWSFIAGLALESKYRVEFFRTNKIINYSWNQNENYEYNGFLLAFTINVSNIIVKKPQGYSKAKIKEINEEMLEYEKQGKVSPDIVVIMSESFSDVTKIEGLKFSEDPIPRFREIGKKGLTGEVYVPVLGGKTANTEFEFLTGYNVKHLPDGSVPYQQHIKNDINSLVGYMKKEGYLTTAIHNNIPEFWNRDNVYEYMGFDRFISIDEFEDPFYFGNWISDKDMMNKIKETLEENEDKNQMIFAVTVQNHAPYYVPGGVEEITVEGDLSDDDKEMLSRYAIGVKISDNELYEFYKYIKKRKKPTILCYFGDHLPGGFSMYRTYPYYKNMEESGASRKDMFATPYIIWSNYKEKPKTVNLGANALSGLMLEYADTKVPGFYGYMASQYENQTMSEHTYFDIKSIYEEIQKLRTNEYQIMYDDLFGKKYKNEN